MKICISTSEMNAFTRTTVHLPLFLGRQRLMAPATDVATKVVPAMTPTVMKATNTMSDLMREDMQRNERWEES